MAERDILQFLEPDLKTALPQAYIQRRREDPRDVRSLRRRQDTRRAAGARLRDREWQRIHLAQPHQRAIHTVESGRDRQQGPQVKLPGHLHSLKFSYNLVREILCTNAHNRRIVLAKSA